MGFWNKLWHFVTFRGWTEGDSGSSSSEEENSESSYRQIGKTGGTTESQNIVLQLIFHDSSKTTSGSGERGGPPNEGNPDVIYSTVINKDTAKGSFIYNEKDGNGNLTWEGGIVQYAVDNKSFSFTDDGILVSPASSDMLDDCFYKAFSLNLNTSASKTLIDEIYISSSNCTVSTSDEKVNYVHKIFGNEQPANEEGYRQDFFDETELLFNDNADDKGKVSEETTNAFQRRFAGKVLAQDILDYPISNNILTFDYYTKYERPIDILDKEFDIEADEAEAAINSVENIDNKRTPTLTWVLRLTTRIGFINWIVGSAAKKIRKAKVKRSLDELNKGDIAVRETGVDKDNKKTYEAYYSLLKDIYLKIDIYLYTKDIFRMNLDIFPPAISDKLVFIPDLKDLDGINILIPSKFSLSIKSYFKIYSLQLTYLNKFEGSGEGYNKKNIYSLINPPDSTKPGPQTLNPTGGGNGGYIISLEELRDINVYQYELIFNVNNVNFFIKDGSVNNSRFIDTDLEFDQSGDENLDFILNNIGSIVGDVSDYESAIKVFSNNTSIGKISDYAYENILVGKELQGGIYEIARYKLREGKTTFGDIHVFYGKYHIRKTGDIIKYSTQIDNDELIVTIKYDPYNIKDGVLGDKDSKIYDYICVNMDDVNETELSEIDKSSPIKITNIASIEQASDVVFSSNINIPLVNFSDETVFIDSAQNSNKFQHYTYITTFSEKATTTYLGVRAYKRNAVHSGETTGAYALFTPEFSNLNIDGLTYNTNAQLVLLKPYETQETIYSFRNGKQMLQVKKEAIDFSYSNTEGLRVKDLLPSYALSYEYLVDGKVPSDPANNYNISFYGLKEHKDWVSSYFTTIPDNDKASYLFTISYFDTNKKENEDDSLYISLLENVDENYPLYSNIYYIDYDDITGKIKEDSYKANIFEETFEELSNNNWQDSDNIYEKVVKYIKLSPGSIRLLDFKTSIKNYSDNLELINKGVENPENKLYRLTLEEDDITNTSYCSALLSSIYYKYSSISKEYTPYTLKEIENLTEVPYNIYYRSIYYLKKAGITKNNYQDYIGKLYVKKWDIIPKYKSPTKDDGLLYLHYSNGYTYLPIYLGIKYDGSVQYYSENNYYLLDFKSDEYRKYSRESLNNIDKVYLKQNYLNIENLNLSKYYELARKGYKFYRQVNILRYIPISDTQTIYDLDLSGDVVYANNEKKIISKNDISYIYYLASRDPDNDWASETSSQIIFNNQNTQISQNNIKSYLLKNIDNIMIQQSPDRQSFGGIYYIVDFSGEYVEVDDTSILSILSTEDSSTNLFYIHKEGYNEFSISENVSFLKEYYGIDGVHKETNYLYYGYNFKFYLKGVSKIPIDKVKEVVDSTGKLYINVSKLFENVDNIPTGSPYLIPEEIQISGKDKTSNNIPILLAEIDKNTSLIKSEYTNINYYTREPVLQASYDIHNNINKNYYTKKNTLVTFGEISLEDNKNLTAISKLDYEHKQITFSDTSLNKSDREYDFDSLKIYHKGIHHYTTVSIGKTAKDIKENLGSYLSSNNPLNDITYSYEVLMQSSFFYSAYTINDGINIAKDGSYFTNISVFDGKNGLITKSLYLNPHIYTITNYKYTYFRENIVPVTNDMDLSQISESEYKNYYIRWRDTNGGSHEKSLSELDVQLPSYWQEKAKAVNATYSLHVKIFEEGEEDYNGQIIKDGNTNTNKYQFFDNYAGVPYTIKYNSNIYGLIFNYSPYEVHESNRFIIPYNDKSTTVTPQLAYRGPEDDYVLFPAEMPDQTQANEAEIKQTAFEIIGETYENKDSQLNDDVYNKDDANFLKAKHYYENFDLGQEIYKGWVKFIPAEYEYEIVPLQEFIYKSKGIDDNVFQNRESIPYDLKEKASFELSNAKKIKFTGSYTWIDPEFSYIGTYVSSRNSYNSSETSYIYKSKKVISRSGYWSKDYIEEEVPLKISSYNYYPKDEVSSVNISYNYLPYSYIMTAEIYHPEITYDYLINDIYEYYKYTYIINGIEKDYPIDGEIIINLDGTYSGLINVLDKPLKKSTSNSSSSNVLNDENIDHGEKQIKVKLYKKLDLGVHSNVKNIVHQKENISYNWYAYIQATPLTNEKVPYLYKKEIIPGHTKKIQYWNSNTNSYAVKEVIDSYSYYSYEYTYEVIPFKVASYIFTDDLRISNFYDLGAYIISLKDGLEGVLGQQAEATQKLNETLESTVDDLSTLIQTEANKWNTNYTTQTDKIDSTFEEFRKEHGSNLTKLSNIIDSSIDDFNEKSNESLKNLTYSVSNSIKDETTLLDNKLSESNKIQNERLTELSSYIHDDIIGEEELKTIRTNTEVSYLYDQKKDELILNSNSENSVTSDRDSLAKILKDSLYGPFEHSKITYNEDGSFTKTTYSGDLGLSEILANLTVIERLPDYNQFMVKVVPELFTNVDFENFYEVQYDSYGNVISTQRRNPVNVAKASIYRADVLWKELKKRSIVE